MFASFFLFYCLYEYHSDGKIWASADYIKAICIWISHENELNFKILNKIRKNYL